MRGVGFCFDSYWRLLGRRWKPKMYFFCGVESSPGDCRRRLHSVGYGANLVGMTRFASPPPQIYLLAGQIPRRGTGCCKTPRRVSVNWCGACVAMGRSMLPCMGAMKSWSSRPRTTGVCRGRKRAGRWWRRCRPRRILRSTLISHRPPMLQCGVCRCERLPARH